MGRLITAHNQYDLDDGSVASGCKLYFYVSGDVTTPKTTYSDSALTTPNTNPVVVDAWGRQPDIFFSGTAKLRVHDANDVLLYEIDPIYADETGGGGGGGAEDDDPWTWYDATVTYAANDIVVDRTSRKWYRASVGSNTGNALTNTTYWVEMGPIHIWNGVHTFAANDFAYYSGLLYRSKLDANTNQNPISVKSYWEPLGLQHRHESIGSITASATRQIDLTLYNSFSATLLGNATFSFINEPESDEKYTFDMILDCSALTSNQRPIFPATVKWTRGFEPNWIGICGLSVVTYPGDTAYYASEYLIDAKVSSA